MKNNKEIEYFIESTEKELIIQLNKSFEEGYRGGFDSRLKTIIESLEKGITINADSPRTLKNSIANIKL